MNYYIIILKIEIHTLYCVQYQFNEVDGVSTNSKHKHNTTSDTP